MRRIVAALAVVVAMVGLTLVVNPGAANAADQVVQLKNWAGGNCLDVQNGGTGNFAPVDVYGCYFGPVEQWELHFIGPGNVYEIRNVNSQRANPGNPMCLEVGNSSKELFAAVDMFPCWGGANQRWYLDTTGGVFRLRNLNSDLCLDDYYGGKANFNRVDQFRCLDEDTSEMWTSWPQ